ncbi:hypothetical protein SAY87_011608 [Trapa incisa]|uniref:SBP-type domain-containing protein n=1 Tax=Trapa incisa TaxID=236973 RepID=A0AAN7JBK7_9MYRT|nr:hypothetical protein SAY87_011608 [Trapa incisa]
MEARIDAEAHHYYGMNSAGKRSLEWNLNDWRWDGDLFIARPLNPAPSAYLAQQIFPQDNRIPTAGNSSNSSPSCSDEANIGAENGQREPEKRRRFVVVQEDSLDDKASSLTLKLGGQGCPTIEREATAWEGNNGKKAKVVGGSGNRAVCQVEDCGADLSNAKDYHRRHKVCEMHSKATRALVGNIMQRFCQQCSRFHALQEFDEGKRSCRRRLAGHNKRRRKTNADATSSANPLSDDQTNGYLLISLLKILSNMHTNQSKQAADQDLLTHLLRSLASSQFEGKNIARLLQESQTINNGESSLIKSDAVPANASKDLQGPSRPMQLPPTQPPPCNMNDVRNAEGQNPTEGPSRLNNFDLNDVYIDLDDGLEDLERSPVPVNPRTNSVDCPSWIHQESHQSSPPQTSRNSDSASAQSPSSSTGDIQSRTDRIVFKLFGKEPKDFPILVRAQILDWLSHSPTDIESYIRPGCIVLTIYLRQSEEAWEELSGDLSSSLSRLLDVSENNFWKTGWMYIWVKHQTTFICNGQLVLDRLLPFRSINQSKILSISPIAVSASERAQFLVKGYDLYNTASRLLCSLEGKYLFQEATQDLLDEDSELQSIKFSCSIPAVIGRGFIEIDDCGLPGSFFPFIVAEADVCSEICTLEQTLELIEADSDDERTTEIEAKDQALEFINEMGWILHRSHLRLRLDQLDPNMELFSFKRFRWLMEFSMDHDWCAVVKKLLDIVFDGAVGAGEHPSLYLALLEMGLVHRAVRRNYKPLVELLLRYVPKRVSDNLASELRLLTDGDRQIFLFRPDAVGPAGLTPLHIAAGKDGSQDVIDALTDDPGMVGVQAWKNALDSTGSTPEDYARLRGHYTYIHLVQRKLNRVPLPPQASHVVLDIPDLSSSHQKQSKDTGPTSSFEIGKAESSWKLAHNKTCKMCDQKLAYGIGGRSLLYRPAMLSMVAIAAVCVCVALLFKSSPEVLYVFRPFRWELLEYGAS